MTNNPLTPQDWFATRSTQRAAFLNAHGWAGVPLVSVGEDMALRRYFRLQSEGRMGVILMESVPDGHPMATPGHSMLDFVRLSAYLRSIGLTVPQVYEVDDREGYLLIEDFGDTSFKNALDQKIVERDALYALSVDALSWLRKASYAGDIDLPDYYASHVHKGRRRLVDWYIPAVRNTKNPDGLVQSYLDVWDQIEKSLPPVPRGFLHIDFHFENLMLLKEKTGIGQCGILDFQGAMIGPAPYDLANLLEDARVDVPADLRVQMLDRYTKDMAREDNENFRAWYRVLATQFHCRVIGQFIRMAVRDNKMRYLPMIPRVAGYIREGLKDPVLAPLAQWFLAENIDFSKISAFELDNIRPLIRPDAF